ncbi:flagellar basal body-associated FliL family protein [Rubrivirga sp.]|uniref:flagellar basal body-associated FliL family protein n=1 Tax=Rubrivirga sp. TaxID=1885344 RepID=UPI003B516A3F
MSADAPAPDAAPKRGKSWLIPVLALVLGGAGAAAVTQSDEIRASVLGAPVAVAADSTAPPPPAEFGEFAELDGIVVNPRETDGRRYLMVKVGVEAEDAATLERLDALKPAAIDAVIGLLSAETVGVLGDIGRRDSLKAEVRNRFNQMLGEDGPVSRVYFTQYVLQ